MQPAEVTSHDLLIARASEYMQHHLTCTVAEAARFCGVSESTLYSAFRKSSGHTPRQQQQKLVCAEAERLLATTDLPVERISEQLGFSSASYFRKVLFRETGLTPSQIRRTAVGRC